MKKTIYKDCCGSYSITVFASGRAHLICCDCYGKRWYDNRYTTERGAKIALSRFCGGMPPKLGNYGENRIT